MFLIYQKKIFFGCGEYRSVQVLTEVALEEGMNRLEGQFGAATDA
jgi:hypothetical protein